MSDLIDEPSRPGRRRRPAADEPTEVWPGRPFPLGAVVGRPGRQLLAVRRERQPGRALPVRRRRQRGAHRGHRAHRLQLARLHPRPRARAALRLPRPGPFEPEDGHRFNPAKLLIDPYAKAIEGPIDLDAASVLPVRPRRHRGRRPRARRRGRRRRHPQVARDRRPASTGRTTAPPAVPWSETVIYEAHVKGFTKQHPDVRDDLQGHLRRARLRRRRRPPEGPRRHRGRAAARPPHRRRELPPRQGPLELLGLQLHRLPRPPRRLRRHRDRTASRSASSRGW